MSKRIIVNRKSKTSRKRARPTGRGTVPRDTSTRSRIERGKMPRRTDGTRGTGSLWKVCRSTGEHDGRSGSKKRGATRRAYAAGAAGDCTEIDPETGRTSNHSRWVRTEGQCLKREEAGKKAARTRRMKQAGRAGHKE